MPEEDNQQELPLTKENPKDNDQDEKSTADSPPKTNLGSDAEKANEDANNSKQDDLVAKTQENQIPNDGGKQQQQDHNAEGDPNLEQQKFPTPSSNFESSFEEDISAKPGGSSIDPESSTSKISAAAGIPDYLLKGLDVSTPEEALEKLLSGGSLNTNSEGISAHVEANKELQLEQELWEAKFKDEFLQHDVLEMMEKDPHAYFSLKALLRQLQNIRSSEALLFLVNQAEVHKDQFAKNQQLLITADESYKAQIQAHASVWADANQCNLEVINMKSEATAAYLKVVAYEDNIAKWKAEIRELEAKIAEEEKLHKHYTEVATQVSPEQIEAKANEGLRLCGNAAVIQAEAQRLDKESNLLKIKLSQIKELYRAFQNVALSNA
jgi:hypothetical protein